MIYFKVIFDTIRVNKLRFLLVWAFVSILLMSFENKDFLLKKVMRLNQKNAEMSFVTDELGKVIEIQNKLMVLPGVKKVEIRSADVLKENLNKLFKDDSFQQVLGSGEFNYVKYMLTFEPSISEKSIKLIKSFIIKILPEKEIVFSKVRGIQSKTDLDNQKKSQLMVFYTFFGLAILISMILMNSFSQEMRKLSYLYQRFQRKKFVLFKSCVSLSVLIAVSSAIPVFAISGEVPIMFIFLTAITTLFFLIVLGFKNYEWK